MSGCWAENRISMPERDLRWWFRIGVGCEDEVKEDDVLFETRSDGDTWAPSWEPVYK